MPGSLFKHAFSSTPTLGVFKALHHSAFINSCPIHIIMAKQVSAGLAYAVFRCTDARPMPQLLARFKAALENIKLAHEETKIPPQTEFSVFDIKAGIASVKSVPLAEVLVGKITAMEKAGANFLIHSKLPNASNDTTATNLGDVMNMLYGGTELFDNENQGRQKLLMDVFYRNGSGVYVSKLSEDSRGAPTT
jgi:hypothetical protein